MLEIEIEQDGGVLINGTRYDLLTLAQWLEQAVELGVVNPTFISDLTVTSITIKCGGS